MKTFFALLLCAVFGVTCHIAAFAQSGRVTSGEEIFNPAPTPTPSGSSESQPNTRRAPNTGSRQLPTLRGGNSTTTAPVVRQTATPTATPTPAVQTAPSANGGEVAEGEEVLRVETSLVTIPVTVLTRQGAFITDLQQNDFTILEDGKAQEIAYFAKTEQPFTVVLLLDVSPSTQFRIDEIQNAAIEFVRNQLKANDRVMVVEFDEDYRVLSQPTSDRNRLERAIRRADFGSGTSLYDAVENTLNKQLRKIEGRKAVVLFTDGVDTTSDRASYKSTIRDAQEVDATIYTVHYNTYRDQDSGGGANYPQRYPRQSGGILGGILGTILGGGGGITIGGGAGNSREDYERGERYVEELTAATGGKVYSADTTRNLETAFYNIAEELRRQYSIGYYPSDTGTAGQRKQIRVRVNRAGLVVRSRDSYVVGEAERSQAASKPTNRIAEQYPF